VDDSPSADAHSTPKEGRPRPKSAFVLQETVAATNVSLVSAAAARTPSPGKGRKERITSQPLRTLQPTLPSPEADLEDLDEDKRFSPEKDLALQTLDDVIQEAEDSMGKDKQVVTLHSAWN
jgi:hypothetical protein